MKKKILYVDMDNVLVDFPRALEQVDEATLSRYRGQEDNIPGLFAMMPTMPGAIDCYEELARMYDTYVLSTAPWENPSAWHDKLLWVKNYLGSTAYKRLIITHHKNLLIGHYLIDDRPNNGAQHFTGEWIRFGSERFPDWVSVKDYLLQLEH